LQWCGSDYWVFRSVWEQGARTGHQMFLQQQQQQQQHHIRFVSCCLPDHHEVPSAYNGLA
jgi:hypothetical protein